MAESEGREDPRDLLVDMQERVSSVERQRIEIAARNTRVEIDKAWETSLARKLLIVALTYGITCAIFTFIHVPAPFTNAIIPSAGYALSTLTIPWAKYAWISASRKSTRR